MRLRIFSFLLIILSLKKLYGQCNLVPNPSFEEYINCPYGFDKIYEAVPWKSGGGSSDLFNLCNDYGVANYFGPMQPKTRAGYAGFGMWDPVYNSEYIKTQLNRPLQIGETYQVDFWHALSSKSSFAADGLGAIFKVGDFTYTNGTFFADIPHVISAQGVPLTNQNWQLFTSTFVADAAYNYIIIGNFYKEADQTKQTVGNNVPVFSYRYIDDVSVTCLSCGDVGRDTTFICENESLVLDGSTPNATYLWQDGSTNATFTASQEQFYWLETIDTASNCINRDSTYLEVIVMTLNLPQDTSFCAKEPLTLNAFNPLSSYFWSPGGETSFQIAVSNNGLYSVVVTNDSVGCKIQGSANVIIYNDCLDQAFIPKTFSPNDDGLNDLFLINSPSPLNQFSISIFNRWGQKIFTSKNQNEGWDGYYKNEKVPPGIYVWKLNYTSISAPELGKEVVGNIVAIF